MKAGREDKFDSDDDSPVGYIEKKGQKQSISIRDLDRNRGMKPADVRMIVERNPRRLKIAFITPEKGERSLSVSLSPNGCRYYPKTGSRLPTTVFLS